MKTYEESQQLNYDKKANLILDRLITRFKKHKPINDAQLEQAQKLVDSLADEYQHNDRIGAGLYKLYLSQTLIYIFQGDLDQAEKFLGEAKRHSENADTKLLEEFLIEQHSTETQSTAKEVSSSDTNINDVLNYVKTEASKSIWKGLILIAVSLGITIATYNLADDGSSFFIFWGLGLWGAVVLAKGVYSYANPLHGLSEQGRHDYVYLHDASLKGWLSVASALIMTFVVSFALINMFAPTLANQIESGGDQTSFYQRNFTEACIESGGSSSLCSCTANYMTNHYSIERLVEIDREYEQTDQVPSELYAAASSCQ